MEKERASCYLFCQMMEEKREPIGPVIFFDGVCHLCNAFVDWVARHDRQKRFRFAPLQGQTAEKNLKPEQRSQLETVLVMHQNHIYEKSDAVLLVFSELGGAWKTFGLLRILPRGLRDIAYEFVAKNRYRFFGKRETCRLPTKDEKLALLP